MYTSHKIHLHNKSLCILEMIQRVNNSLSELQSRLNIYDNTKDWAAPIKLMNKREDFLNDIARFTLIKERLVNYYKRTLEKLMPVKELV